HAQDVDGLHDRSGAVRGAYDIQAHANIFERVGDIGACLAIDANADFHASRDIFWNIRDAGTETAVGKRLPRHRRTGSRGPIQYLIVGVDEVAEVLVRPERAGIDEILELLLYFFLAVPAPVGVDSIGFGKEMRLIERPEFIHQTFVEFRV